MKQCWINVGQSSQTVGQHCMVYMVYTTLFQRCKGFCKRCLTKLLHSGTTPCCEDINHVLTGLIVLQSCFMCSCGVPGVQLRADPAVLLIRQIKPVLSVSAPRVSYQTAGLWRRSPGILSGPRRRSLSGPVQSHFRTEHAVAKGKWVRN